MKSFGSGPAPGGRLAEAVAGPAALPSGSRPGGARDRTAARSGASGRQGVHITATTEAVAPAGIGAYLIALGLILATAAAVLSGGWIGGAQATLLVAVVAVVEAILLGRSGIGRLAALGLAIPLCAAVVVPTTIGLLPPSVSRLGLQHTVGEYIVQAFGGLLVTGPNYYVQWAFMVGLSTIVWACGYWLGWVAFRERRGVLAVLPAVVILAVNVLNAPSITLTAGPGSSIGLAETLALLAALLVIGLAELSSLAFQWRGRRIPTLQGLRGRYVTSLVVASIGVVAAGLLIPPVTSTDISDTLFHGSGRGLGGSAAGTLATVGFNPEVAPGGDLVNRPVPVLTYSTALGAGTYLQAVDDTVFGAGTWIPQFQTAVGQTIPAGAIPRDPTALGASRTTATVHIDFANSAGAATGEAGGSLGLFPGDPTSVSLPGTVIGDVAPTSGTPAPTASPPPGYECVGDNCPTSPLTLPSFLDVDEVSLRSGSIDTLETSGSVSTATVAELENAGTDYPSWVLSDADPIVAKGASAQAVAQANAISTLAAQWTAGTTNPYDAATAIEGHLRSGVYAYTLDPPRTPSGEWPIVYFLDSSHQGYCQYYASAMGAMLRSLGIPTMLVSGYGPGTATGRTTAAHQPIYQVTSTDAHVWVEAYFPGYGWIPFEPTPQSTFGGYLPFARGGPTPPPSAAAIPTRTPLPSRPTPRPVTSATATKGAAGPPSAWLLTFPGLLVLVAVLALAGLRWWRRPRSLAGVWRRLALAARLSGVRPDEAETRRAFALRLSHALGGSGPPLLGTELGTVAAVSGKAEFSSGGLADPDRRLWRDTWGSLAPALTRLLRRRLLRRRAAV
ncbi:MAG: transglutaminase-like domain-containing protein [Candidatus Dormibacteria bacterium]|jgi:transglutaminase-like putative cysteine protease